jgi:hypothetical protein
MAAMLAAGVASAVEFFAQRRQKSLAFAAHATSPTPTKKPAVRRAVKAKVNLK